MAAVAAAEQKTQKLQLEYKEKLQKLDREQLKIQEDRLQSEKYKSFVKDYKEIIVALTARLNERDEAILQL